MELLSIIVPCYNEEAALPYFLDAFKRKAAHLRELFSLDMELIFVDDGSRDGTLPLLRAAAREDERVRYIAFSRNFGKEAAMYAGFQHAKGDYIVMMDADLQDPPSLLPEMFEALQSGVYDSAATRWVIRRGEPPIRSSFVRMFYRIINKISKADIVDGARDFRLMRRQVVDSI